MESTCSGISYVNILQQAFARSLARFSRTAIGQNRGYPDKGRYYARSQSVKKVKNRSYVGRDREWDSQSGSNTVKGKRAALLNFDWAKIIVSDIKISLEKSLFLPTTIPQRERTISPTLLLRFDLRKKFCLFIGKATRQNFFYRPMDSNRISCFSKDLNGMRMIPGSSRAMKFIVDEDHPKTIKQL